jgi:hypothetical protein
MSVAMAKTERSLGNCNVNFEDLDVFAFSHPSLKYYYVNNINQTYDNLCNNQDIIETRPLEKGEKIPLLREKKLVQLILWEQVVRSGGRNATQLSNNLENGNYEFAGNFIDYMLEAPLVQQSWKNEKPQGIKSELLAEGDTFTHITTIQSLYYLQAIRDDNDILLGVLASDLSKFNESKPLSWIPHLRKFRQMKVGSIYERITPKGEKHFQEIISAQIMTINVLAQLYQKVKPYLRELSPVWFEIETP